MPKETLDGAQREVEIDLKAKVQEMLEEGAAQASAAKSSEDQHSNEPARQSDSPASQATDDDVIEYETGQGRQSLRLSEVAKDPAARRALAEQLSRSNSTPKPAVDEQLVEQARRRGAIERDIARGLVRVNEYTGQLEETALGRSLREQAEGRSGKPAADPDDADPLSTLDETERAELQELRRKAIEEGDVEALAKSDDIIGKAHRRFSKMVAGQAARTVQEEIAKRERAAETMNVQARNRQAVDQEMARHPEFFGKYDPSTGRFENEVRAQIARNQVAAMLEVTRSAKVDDRHLAAIPAVMKAFTGAPAPGGGPGPDKQRQSSAPPPSVGRGAKVPPGPPPRQAGEGTPARKPDSGRPQLGTPAMVDAVAKRLQSV